MKTAKEMLEQVKQEKIEKEKMVNRVKLQAILLDIEEEILKVMRSDRKNCGVNYKISAVAHELLEIQKELHEAKFRIYAIPTGDYPALRIYNLNIFWDDIDDSKSDSLWTNIFKKRSFEE